MESLSGPRINDTRNIVSATRQKLLAQRSRPSDGNHPIHFPALLDLSKGPRRLLDARSGAGGNPLAAVEAPAPEIDAI